MNANQLFIGVLSGTSMDGIDVGLVDLAGPRPGLVAARMHPMPAALRERLMALCAGGGPDSVDANAIDELGVLDALLGELFAEAVMALLEETGLGPAEIRAIGSHGQTVRHRPPAPHATNASSDSRKQTAPFTLQIADPNIIAERTGITTVADFRRRDMAAGGQGAPLVPAFHRAMFEKAGKDRAVVNIGGMANVTILPAKPSGGSGEEIIGFDTGPGNVLLDAWASAHLGTPMDTGGRFARDGRGYAPLLARCRADPYFSLPAPKTCGREHFNEDWLRSCLIDARVDTHPAPSPADIQRALCDLTVTTIRDAILQYAPACREVFVCGGGARNPVLMSGLDAELPGRLVDTTARHGVDPDWVEAMAFAWLARCGLDGRPGNVPSVTGARRPVVLGAVYPGAYPGA